MTSRLRLAAQALLDAMRWEEELRAHVLTHDGDCLVHALRRALAEHAGEPGVPSVDECERIAFKAGVEACHDYGRDMALHFLERAAHPAATGEGT